MFNNLKHERKHLTIVKQYHKTDFNPILCKEKKIIKETSEEGRVSFLDRILGALHRVFLVSFLICNSFILPPYEGLNLFGCFLCNSPIEL